MFTGLVEAMVPLISSAIMGKARRLVFDCSRLSEVDSTRIGDSIALNGCCLTVIDCEQGRLSFDAGEETLKLTNLGSLVNGQLVNLERSLQVGSRMGGHFVTGHIDGTGSLVDRRDDGPWSYLYFSAPEPLLRQMARKGSIAIDGVSLTLVDVTDQHFSVALIPHTLSVTTLGQLTLRSLVNLETDLLAKYAQRPH